MREALALVRASWLSAASYRLATLLSLFSLVATIVPIYFIAGAIQPIVAQSIQTEGGQYFAFLLLGLVTLSFVTVAVNNLPSAIGSGIGTGTLEALLATPARFPALLLGFVGYAFIWAAIRAAVMVGIGVALGAAIVWSKLLVGIVILLLIILAYLPFGMLSAAAIIAFRTPTPLGRLAVAGSALLGGAYYSTAVIPSWLQRLSGLVPLTYGLRALRRTLLEDMDLPAVLPDILALSAFALGLLLLSSWTLSVALRYARRSGSLSQY